MPTATNKIELGTDPGALSAGGTAELRAPSPSSLKIELDAPGGSLLERLGASIPSTPEGKVRFLEKIYGPGRVKTTSDGTILIPTADGRALRPFDEKAFTAGDVAEALAGPLLPAIGGGIGAAVGAGGAGIGAVPGAAGGAAVGAGVRNAAAQVLTGGTGQSPLDIAAEVATEGVIGGVSQGVFGLGARVADTVFRPHNWVARLVNRQMETAAGKEGQRLSAATGIDLTPGEASGSRALLQGEAFARRTPGGADLMWQFEQERLGTVLAKLRDVLDTSVAPNAPVGGTFKVGSDLATTFEDALDQASKIRRAQADLDFQAVSAASNGVPVIPTGNVVKAMQQVIDEFDVPGGGDYTQRVVNQVKAALKGLLDENGQPIRLTGQEAQRRLQLLTDAQRGTGSLFADMERSQGRLVAGRIKDAAIQDLDQAVGEAGGDAANYGAHVADAASATATALKTARDHYRLNSEAVNEVTNSTLAKLIGTGTRAPEAVAERLLRAYPSEIKSVMQLVDKASPETGEAVRRLWIEDAIRAASVPVTDTRAMGLRFSAGRFIKALPDAETMEAAGFTSDARFEINQLAQVLDRIAASSYEAGGSQTAFRMVAWDAIKGAFGVFTSPVGTARAAVAYFAPMQIAKAITTPEGRAALRTLTSTSSNTKAIGGALTSLLAITGTEPAGENVRPLAPITPRDRPTTLDEEMN